MTTLTTANSSAAAAPVASTNAPASSNTTAGGNAPLAEGKGVLVAQLPNRDRAPAYTADERGARWAAAEQNKFSGPDADRWMDLERMRANTILATSNPNGPDKPDSLYSYVGNLQTKLESTSVWLADARKELMTLEKGSSFWRHIPGSGENREMSDAKALVTRVAGKLESLRAEVDKLLNQQSSIFYQRPIDVRQFDSTGYFRSGGMD